MQNEGTQQSFDLEREEMVAHKDKTPVAENMVTLCRKCKMELSHVVIAHNAEGIVARVKCRTCGSEHKYSPYKKPSRKTVTTSKNSTRTRKTDYAEEFQKLAEKYKDTKPVHYSMSGSYRAEDVVDHQKFGVGIVMNVSYQKMEVAFPGGLRILVCGR